MSGGLVLDRAERDTLSHVEVVCRKVAAEARGDTERNLACAHRTPPVSQYGAALTRVVTGLTLTRVRTRPHEIAMIGDWTAEYLAGTVAVDAFASAPIAGLETRPLFDATGRPHAAVRQLWTGAVLNPAARDASIERVVSHVAAEHGALRHLGCLAYPRAALAAAGDCSRTAEPWCGWQGQPSWVMSRRVEARYRERQLRGWAFRPVLTLESTLYEAYAAAWQTLTSHVASARQSRFDGGRY